MLILEGDKKPWQRIGGIFRKITKGKVYIAWYSSYTAFDGERKSLLNKVQNKVLHNGI